MMTRFKTHSLLLVLFLMLVLIAAGCGDDAAYGGNNAYSGGDGSYAAGDAATGGGAGGGGRSDEGSPEHKAGQLTAGEWSDLEDWAFWEALFGQDAEGDWGKFENQWGMFTHDRFAVRVVAGESPIADAAVRLKAGGQTLWQARTDNRGRAELYDGFFGSGADAAQYTVEVDTSGGTETITLDGPTGGERRDIVVEQANAPAHVLDLMFVIDTTGSMGDELSYIQSELHDVIQRTKQDAGTNLEVRLSVNFYRDSDDNYVVRSFPFTDDIDQALDDLQAQNSAGGGDYPEAVGSALADAIDGHQWSQEATARLLFLVLDAPPHNETQVIESVQESTRKAAEKGVRIIPLSGSGVDKQTEFLVRFMDIATGGTYIFLTNDSGIGGDHIEPTVGDYEVEKLNDLLTRVITEYSVQH